MTSALPMAAAVGLNVKRRREACGISQPQLSLWMARHGRPEWVSNQISALERGHRKRLWLEDLLLFAAALECTVPALLSGADALITTDFALSGQALGDVLAGKARIVGEGSEGLTLLESGPDDGFARLSTDDVEGLRRVSDYLSGTLDRINGAA